VMVPAVLACGGKSPTAPTAGGGSTIPTLSSVEAKPFSLKVTLDSFVVVSPATTSRRDSLQASTP